MKRQRWSFAACACLAHLGIAWAAEPGPGGATAAQQITRSGTQTASVGPAEYFTGRVRVDPVWPADDGISASGGIVSFEAGARSAWHTHPAGQRLVVASGVGLTQEWGKPVQEIRAGDVVWCPPNVKHWHGASPGMAMSHLAVTGTLDGKNVQWLEKVSDEQYASRAGSPPLPALLGKQQAIGPIGAAVAQGDMPMLGLALNEGLDAGLTVNDAKEILVQLYAYTGFPRSLNALGELMKVVESRRQRGLNDAPGRDPAPVPTGQEMLALGTANQTRLSGAPVKGPLFDFAPAIDSYLKSHLFGDIFSRDNLDWQSRELATVSALAALPGAEPQLRSHVRISLNVGLTLEQLRSLADAQAQRGQPEAARRARAAIDAPG